MKWIPFIIFISLLGSVQSHAGDEKKFRMAMGLQSYKYETVSPQEIEKKYIQGFQRLRTFFPEGVLNSFVLDRYLESWEKVKKNNSHRRPSLESSVTSGELKHLIENELEEEWSKHYLKFRTKRPKDFMQTFIETTDKVELQYWYLWDLFIDGNTEADLPEDKILKLNEIRLPNEQPYLEGKRWLNSEMHQKFKESRQIIFLKKWDQKEINKFLFLHGSDYYFKLTALTEDLTWSEAQWNKLILSSAQQTPVLCDVLLIYTLSQQFKKSIPFSETFLNLVEKGYQEFLTLPFPNLMGNTQQQYLLQWLQDQVISQVEEVSQRKRLVANSKVIQLYQKVRNHFLEQNPLVLNIVRENYPVPNDSESYHQLNGFWMDWYEKELLLNYELNLGYPKYVLPREKLGHVFEKMGLGEDFQNKEILFNNDSIDSLNLLRNEWNRNHPLTPDGVKCISYQLKGFLN